MTFKTFASIGILVACPTVAMAQHGGSAEDQLACTPDVYRLCSSLIPNEDAIVGCLKSNKASLSPACKQVFSRPAPKAQQGTDDDSDDD